MLWLLLVTSAAVECMHGTLGWPAGCAPQILCADRPTTPSIPSPCPCSKPTVTAANKGGNSYDVTITPVTTMPLKSYPAGGWTYYFIDTEAGFPPGNERFTCT